ncbi:MAG: hypothetical protein H6933_14590 [Burkholderiaceae bacterium]|nr:hypothetical protein [Burkholderiaceae bacterium]
MIRRRERVMAVLWPAFLMAGVMEMLVFAFVDPTQLHLFGGAPLDWSPTSVYTVAFFLFWGVIAAAASLTELLELGAEDLNSGELR